MHMQRNVWGAALHWCQRCGSSGLLMPSLVGCLSCQRYLGTAREDNALNIFLEFVPGGSIASLLSKFGCFTEKVGGRQMGWQA